MTPFEQFLHEAVNHPSFPAVMGMVLLAIGMIIKGYADSRVAQADKDKQEAENARLINKFAEGFKVDLDKSNAEIRTLRRENQNLEVKLAEIKGAREADKEHFKERMSEEKNAREGEILRLARSLEEVRASDNSKDVTIEALTAQLADVQNQLTALKLDLAAEREQNKALESTREQLEATTAKQAERIVELETEVTGLKQKIEALENKNLELQKQVNNLIPLKPNEPQDDAA